MAMNSALEETSMDPDTMCRFCLKENQDLRAIFRKEVVNGHLMAMPQILADTLGIIVEPNPKLPPKICNPCKQRVCEMYIFKENALKCNGLLLQLFQANDKKMTYSCPVITSDAIIQTDAKADEAIETVEERPLQSEVSVQTEDNMTSRSCDQEVQTDDMVLEEEFVVVEDAESWTKQDNDDGGVVESAKESDFDCKTKEDLSNYQYIVISKDEVEEDYGALEDNHQSDIEVKSNIEWMSDGDIGSDFVPDEMEEDEDEFQETDVYSMQDTRKQSANENCTVCNVNMAEKKFKTFHKKYHEMYLPAIAQSITVYRCVVCSTLFLNANKLRDHFSTCDEAETVTSELSDGPELAGVWLESTIFSCSRTEHNTLACDICGMIANDFKILLQHFSSQHDKYTIQQNEFSVHRCSCGEIFENLLSCVNHIVTHLCNLKCPVDKCKNAKDLFTTSELFHHVYQNHHYNQIQFGKFADKKKTFDCRYCDEKLTTAPKLLRHLTTVHQKKMFSCDMCDKSFSSKHDMQVHIRIHTNERPYKCHFCEKRFKTFGQRSDHLSTHSSTKNVQCHICSEHFKSKRILRGHMSIHMPEKHYECPVCSKLFKRATHVKSHLRVHEKDQDDELIDQIVSS